MQESDCLLMMGTELTDAAADERTPSTAVIEAVAAAEGCDPQDLASPLYAHVDPDALDSFVDSPAETCVRFQYHGYQVRVEGDGGVTVVGSTE